MKTLLITNKFPPLIDGVGDHTWHLANGLSKGGYEVEILCLADAQIKGDCSEASFKVFPIIRDFSLQSIMHLCREVLCRKADIVMFQYVPYAYSSKGVPLPLIFLFAYLRYKGIKVITIVHEPFIRFSAGFKNIGVALAQRLIAFSIFGLSTALITSISLYKRFLSSYNKYIYQIPIGSNIVPATLSYEDKSRVRLQYAEPGTCLIATFGNRNPQLLLDALRILLQMKFSVKLLFLGNNKKLDAILEKGNYADLEPHLHTTGFLMPELLFKLLLVSDIFVLPEIVDARGRGGVSLKSGSLAAAFAAGLPIISCRGDMTDDSLKHNENILMSEPDPEKLAASIIQLQKDKELCAILKNNATGFYANHLDWNKIADQYQEVIMNT